MKKIIYLLLVGLSVLACNKPEKVQEQNEEIAKRKVEHSYTNTNPHEVYEIAMPNSNTPVKNVILMIGDGMGLNVVQAAMATNKGKLFLQNANYIGFSNTSCQDTIITDSAAAGTAMATGHKTYRGALGLDAEGNSVESITEFAKKAGLSTGIISSCRIYDATPAAFAVENKTRYAYEAIAKDFADSNVDFVLGAGLEMFDKHRKDRQSILPLLQEKGYEVVTTMEELNNAKTSKIFGLVGGHDMPEASERGDMLWKGTEKALNVLSQNEKGFFLMVEGGLIDDYGHANNLQKMMQEVHDFDRTIGKVCEWASKNPGTLIIVTADHATGGLTVTESNLEQTHIVGYFSSTHHDGVTVPVYAFGAEADKFGGWYNNYEICTKMKEVFNLKK